MTSNRLILTPSKDCSDKTIVSLFVKSKQRAIDITKARDNWVKIKDAKKYNSLSRSRWYDSSGIEHKLK